MCPCLPMWGVGLLARPRRSPGELGSPPPGTVHQNSKDEFGSSSLAPLEKGLGPATFGSSSSAMDDSQISGAHDRRLRFDLAARRKAKYGPRDHDTEVSRGKHFDNLR